jgi:hypothetical protein
MAARSARAQKSGGRIWVALLGNSHQPGPTLSPLVQYVCIFVDIRSLFGQNPTGFDPELDEYRGV